MNTLNLFYIPIKKIIKVNLRVTQIFKTKSFVVYKRLEKGYVAIARDTILPIFRISSSSVLSI